MNQYRYELKFEIPSYQADTLKKQLGVLMQMDSHSISNEYSYDIRSIYFDDINSSAFYDKIDGVEYRSKYRIRIYNLDDHIIKFECKHKDENMTYKQACDIDLDTCEKLLSGDYLDIENRDQLVSQFIANSYTTMLRPSVIVDYRRTAFTYPMSEIRITFDEDIASGRYSTELFNDIIPTYPVYPKGISVMEVKFNEFIPDHLLAVLQSVQKVKTAISKFAMCRNIKAR